MILSMRINIVCHQLFGDLKRVETWSYALFPSCLYEEKWSFPDRVMNKILSRLYSCVFSSFMDILSLILVLIILSLTTTTTIRLAPLDRLAMYVRNMWKNTLQSFHMVDQILLSSNYHKHGQNAEQVSQMTNVQWHLWW